MGFHLSFRDATKRANAGLGARSPIAHPKENGTADGPASVSHCAQQCETDPPGSASIVSVRQLPENKIPVKIDANGDLPSWTLDPGIQAGMTALVDYFQGAA
jgi:hypothetical protein